MNETAERWAGAARIGVQAGLSDDATFEEWLDLCVRNEWVVYAKAPFGGPEQVLKYLARYTHRVAISNQRLVACEDGQVTFRWKDYAGGQAQKTMTLSADEFLRRFLTHVLPRGFVKIRHFGFLANRHRQPQLARARELLKVAEAPPPATAGQPPATSNTENEVDAIRCPACGQGRLHDIEQLSRWSRQIPLVTLLHELDHCCGQRPSNDSS
ncbi:MAG: transposase [Planctomycetaceae bacterium]|nr:transposase [Planctomycetaceae bacterium]